MKLPVEMLTDDLWNRIDYWRVEANLTYAETIGALELIKADLIQEALEASEEESQ